MKDEKDLGATPRRSSVHVPEAVDAASHVVAPTAGPWEVYDQGKDDGDGYGCFVRSTTDPLADWIASDVQNRSDAHLISAAPELLEALKALVFPMEAWNEAVARVTGEQPVVNDALMQAKAAIAKAEGHQVGCVSDSATGHSVDSRAQRKNTLKPLDITT